MSVAQESGLVVVDKAAGMTSHDVVARMRRIVGTRKVGHAGTLDPMATGVLVLGINKATRLLGHLMLGRKRYDATIRLGQSTVTDDAEGEVVSRNNTGHLTDDAVRETLAGFVGDIEQVPSSVSAIKVDGQRAYNRVRAGEQVELAGRPVTIYELIVGQIGRSGDVVDVQISVTCSSGTYIRAIARDLGSALEVGGHLIFLRRTAVGDLDLSDAGTLALIEETGELGMVDMATAGRRFFTHVAVDVDAARAVSYGQKLDLELPVHDGPVAVLGPDGEFLALYEQKGAVAVPVAVFTS